jgi:outer membrane lipoprotein-sorting protein
MRPAENIEKLIKKLRYKAGAETHEKILGNVLEALDEHERQKSGVPKPEIWRTIMSNKITKLAVAAAIVIVVLIGLHYFAGPVSVTTSAYAEIAQRLQNARTLLYTVTTTTPVQGMPNMVMEVAFKEPGYMRMTMPGGYISVMDCIQGKGLSIIPEKKQFIEMQISNLPDDGGRRQFDAIEKLRALPDRADEVLGERQIDGRTVQGFRVTEEGATNTVWIDPKTRELVETEMEFDNAPGMSSTMTNFRFNAELSDEFFSIAPPDGYTRLELQVDAREASEDDLIEYLRLWSSWTNDGTFPPTLNPAELAKAAMEMAKAGKFGPDQTTEQQQFEHAMKMTRGMMFVLKLPAQSNWRYAGQNVKHGDAQTPIFWYQPAGSATYRAIYGDLSIKDVTPENLPK